jgi:hypothetical protein
MKQLLLFAFSLFVFCACSNSDKVTPKSTGWDETNKTEFMEQCFVGAVKEFKKDTIKAKAYCACMLSKIEDRYPVPDSAGTMSYNDMTILARACLK